MDNNKLLQVLWIVGTIMLVFSMATLGISTIIIDNKISYYQKNLFENEYIKELRFGNNYLDYQLELTQSMIYHSSALIIDSLNGSKEKYKHIMEESIQKRKDAYLMAYLIFTNKLPSNKTIEELNHLSSLSEIWTKELELIQNETLSELQTKITDDHRKISNLRKLRGELIIIIIIVQTIGLILINIAEFQKNKQRDRI